MKRILVLVACFALLAVIAVAYALSSYSWSTTQLRVTVIEANGGHQAMLQNKGILPVKIVVCKFNPDTGEPNPVYVGDVIQREQPNIAFAGDPLQRGVPAENWEDSLVRNGCERGRTRTQLLWRGQRVYSSPFFPNVGIGRAFQHQDIVRFLLFPHGGDHHLEVLDSVPFRVDDVEKLPSPVNRVR
jgi:hypothetical protein